MLATSCGSDPLSTADRSNLQVLVVNPDDSVGTTHAVKVDVVGRDGEAAVGVPVLVSVTTLDDTSAPVALVRVPGVSGPGPSGQTVTDDEGRTAAILVYTFSAGPGRLHIDVPSLALADSTPFHVRPGVAERMILAPDDSVVLVGGSYRLRAHVADAHGNTTDAPITFRHLSGPGTVQADGVITGEAVGRVAVRASGGGLARVGRVSVVPAFQLAAFAASGAATGMSGIYVSRSDGDGGRFVYGRVFRATASSSAGWWPTWLADSDTLLFTDQDQLWILGPGDAPQALVGGDPPVSNRDGLQASRDGAWIFFTRGALGFQRTAWRVRPDGRDLSQVSESVTAGIEAMPSPSPDGTRIVYHTNRVTNSPDDFTLRTLTLATGAVDALDISGSSPRWSPTNEMFVYLGPKGHVRTVRSDGTGPALVGEGRGARIGLAVSPDGQWYLGVGATGLELVRLVDGLVLPLALRGPDGQTLIQPAWGIVPD